MDDDIRERLWVVTADDEHGNSMRVEIWADGPHTAIWQSRPQFPRGWEPTKAELA